MATVDELVVRIRADSRELHRELARVKTATETSLGGLSGPLARVSSGFASLIPAASIAAVGAFATKAIALQGALQDLADRTGVSASFIGGLRTEIENAGGSVDGFAQSLLIMNNFIGEAAKGNEEARNTLNQLGTSFEELKDLSPEDQFRRIADGLALIPTQYERTEAARAVFGRGVAALLPLLEKGSAGLDDMAKNSKALSDDQIKAIDNMQDGWNKYINVLQNRIAGGFADFVGFMNNQMAKLNMADPTAGMLKNRLGEIDQEIAHKKKQIDALQSKNKGSLSESFVNVKQKEIDQLMVERGAAQQRLSRVTMGSESFGPSLPAPKPKVVIASGGGGGTGGGGGGGMTAAQKRMNELQQEAARLSDRNLTVYEKYADGATKAQELLNKKLITHTDYQREMTRLQEEFSKATEKSGDVAVESFDKAGEAAIINARVIKDYIGDSLESAMFDFQNFGNAASSILNGIARQMARQRIIDPLAKAGGDFLGGLFDGGIGSISQAWGFATKGGIGPFPSFDVGAWNLPSDMLANVHKGEMIIPAYEAEKIRNGGMGGVSVVNNFSFSTGVTRQEVASLIPMIEARTRESVFAAIERGGTAAKVVGRRN